MKCLITDGARYAAIDDGANYITSRRPEAHRFKDPSRAWNFLENNGSRYDGFCVCDLKGNPVRNPKRKKSGSVRRKFTEEEKLCVYERFRGRCVYCGDYVEPDRMTIDHKIPLSRGGTNKSGNLQLTCHICNGMKGSIMPDEFFRHIRKILRHQERKRLCKWIGSKARHFNILQGKEKGYTLSGKRDIISVRAWVSIRQEGEHGL